MAKGPGTSISIVADGSLFDKAVRQDVIAPLEDAADVLDQVAKDGDRAGERLEGSMRDAQKETDDLKDEVGELRKALDKAGSQGKRTGKDLKDGFDQAAKGADEFKDEAKQSAREAAASFDGSADSIVDYFQEVAANAFSGFGPAGAVAGLALAGGIGLAVSSFQQGQANAEALKARISELTSEMIQLGNDGAPSIEFLVDKLQELATTSEPGETNLQQLAKVAKAADRDFKSLAQAYAGNTDGLKGLVKENERLADGMSKYGDAAVKIAEARGADLDASSAQIQAQRDYVGYLRQAEQAAADAAEQERNYILAGGLEWDAKRAMIEAVNDAYDDAAGSAEDYINAESGLFDVGAYISAMQERQRALNDYQNTLASSSLSPEARAFLNQQGVDAAAQFLAGYKRATPAQQAELNRIWTEAGKTSSGEFKKSAYNAIPDRIDKTPRVNVTADTDAAQREVNKFVRNTEGRTVTLTARIVDRNGRPIL